MTADNLVVLKVVRDMSEYEVEEMIASATATENTAGVVINIALLALIITLAMLVISGMTEAG